jgi:inosine-uridine nucleoside N-ribohydrolase
VSRLNVILDCDPGHDDVIAILLAAHHTRLAAVTTVSGNAPLEWTTRNALAALQMFGLTVPVSPGADRALVAPPRHAPDIHGDRGLAGAQLPVVLTQPEQQLGVERILQASRSISELWIVATGPLTNVALALRADPGLAGRLAGISIMGGGLDRGNATPTAEFNFWADPEAAEIVVTSGARIFLSGLDVTNQVLVDEEFVARVRGIGNRISGFLADVFAGLIAGYREFSLGEDVAPVHDACAVLAVTHPELFEFRDLHADVQTGEGIGAGTMIADRRGLKGQRPPNVAVAVAVDRSGVLDVIEATIRQF